MRKLISQVIGVVVGLLLFALLFVSLRAASKIGLALILAVGTDRPEEYAVVLVTAAKVLALAGGTYVSYLCCGRGLVPPAFVLGLLFLFLAPPMVRRYPVEWENPADSWMRFGYGFDLAFLLLTGLASGVLIHRWWVSRRAGPGRT